MDKQDVADHSGDERGRWAVNGRSDSSDRGVLLITCSDIGIDPYALIPHEHSRNYVIQNAGNLVRPDDPQVQGALALYDVQVIVLCGHSACDVVRRLFHSAHGAVPPTSPAAPIVYPAGYPTGHQPPGDGTDGGLITSHLLTQFQNLMMLPEVVARKATNALDLYCWVYDNETDAILQYDSRANAFRPRK
jgi:carbonic anhydrase